MKLLSKVFRWG